MLEQLFDAERGVGEVGLAWHRSKRREVAVDEPGIDFALAEFVRSCQSSEKGHIAPWPCDHCAIKRGREPVQRRLARRCMRNELADHRVVIRCDLAARPDTGIATAMGRTFTL